MVRKKLLFQALAVMMMSAAVPLTGKGKLVAGQNNCGNWNGCANSCPYVVGCTCYCSHGCTDGDGEYWTYALLGCYPN